MVPRVLVDISRENLKDPYILMAVGYRYDALLDKYHMGDQSVDFVYLADSLTSFTMPANLKQIYNYKTWLGLRDKTNIHPLYTLSEYLSAPSRDTTINFVFVSNDDLKGQLFETLE